MRWRKRYSRIVKRFALFPVKAYLNGFCVDDEYRWLETVYLRQFRDWLWGVIPIWRTKTFATKGDYLKYLTNMRKDQTDHE